MRKCTFKVDPIKSHGLGCLIRGATLQEGEVLISVDMASQDRVALGREILVYPSYKGLVSYIAYLCLSQTRQVHLLVEEVNHLLLRETEGDVAHVDSPGLPGDGGAHHRHCSLWSVWHQTSRDLSSSLQVSSLVIN